MNEQIRQRFRQLFGIDYEEGKAEMIALIKRAVSMGKTAQSVFPVGRHGDFDVYSSNRISDRDLLLIGFFALVGAGSLDELGIPKQLESSPAASEMTDQAIAVELAELGKKWEKFRSAVSDYGAQGSPGEWMFERMGELETEQRRRAERFSAFQQTGDDDQTPKAPKA